MLKMSYYDLDESRSDGDVGPLGKLPMSNMAYPQVLMLRLVVKIPMRFSKKPAFTWRNRKPQFRSEFNIDS